MEKGQKHSEETKLRMKNSHLGKPHPWNKGVPLSQEVRDKISKRHLGKKKSEEHRQNISKGKKGIQLSEEHKYKLAQLRKGTKLSEEHKRKIGEASRKRIWSKESRKKLSEANKGERSPRFGTHHSEEHKRKLSEASRGAKGNNWKGGITPFRKIIRESWKYVEWRQKCFLRDNFTCQKCGACGEYLEVHHKKSFAKLLKEAIGYMPLFSIYDACILYVPMWDINNGTTLCLRCHNKTKRAISKKTQI